MAVEPHAPRRAAYDPAADAEFPPPDAASEQTAGQDLLCARAGLAALPGAAPHDWAEPSAPNCTHAP